jgi:hypothetical protein
MAVMDYLERYDNQPTLKTVMTALTMKDIDTKKFFDRIKRSDLKKKLENQSSGFRLDSLEDGLCIGVSTNDKSLIEHCLKLGADPRKRPIGKKAHILAIGYLKQNFSR